MRIPHIEHVFVRSTSSHRVRREDGSDTGHARELQLHLLDRRSVHLDALLVTDPIDSKELDEGAGRN